MIAKTHLYLLRPKGSLAVTTYSAKHSSGIGFLQNCSNLDNKSGEQRLSECSQSLRLFLPGLSLDCSLNTTSCQSTTFCRSVEEQHCACQHETLSHLLSCDVLWGTKLDSQLLAGSLSRSAPRLSSSVGRWARVRSRIAHTHRATGWRLMLSVHSILSLVTISDTLDCGQTEAVWASSSHLTSNVVCHLILGNLKQCNFCASPFLRYQVEHL